MTAAGGGDGSVDAITAEIACAARVLDGVVHRTPVLTSRTLDDLAGRRVLLKAEHLQRVGAFKIRGAVHAVSHLEPGTPVVAYSSGNHAQAVALAARLRGHPATIVMPHDAPVAKRSATEGYGATVVGYDRVTEDRAEIAREIAATQGAHVIAPFDDPHVIAGQGTAARELTDEHPVDQLLVPLGGGGLLAGTLLAVPEGTEVWGVEPATGDDWAQSLRAGERVTIDQPRTIADSLASRFPGELTWPIVRDRVAGVITVTEQEMVHALRFAVDRLHQVLEPGGAIGLAALLAGKAPAARTTGVLLSGGNVGAERLAELLAT